MYRYINIYNIYTYTHKEAILFLHMTYKASFWFINLIKFISGVARNFPRENTHFHNQSENHYKILPHTITLFSRRDNNQNMAYKCRWSWLYAFSVTILLLFSSSLFVYPSSGKPLFKSHSAFIPRHASISYVFCFYPLVPISILSFYSCLYFCHNIFDLKFSLAILFVSVPYFLSGNRQIFFFVIHYLLIKV